MTFATDRPVDLATLAAVIARSQIVSAPILKPILAMVLLARPAASRRLPEGYDGADIAVLEWIAAEGRRTGRSFVAM